MSKTAKKNPRLVEKAVDTNVDQASFLGLQAQQSSRALEAAMFAVMRILKRINPGDAYFENYLGMRAKYGEKFFDTYQLLWTIGIARAPRRILEIGTRTGISLCQLLSAMSEEDRAKLEKVVCVDPFDQWTSPNLVRANLRYLNLAPWDEQTLILAMTSDSFFAGEAIGFLKGGFDYILVDGDHSKEAARKDLENAHGLIEEGGIIVFDDISDAPGECALIDVWRQFADVHKDEYWFAESMEGKGVAWAIRK